MYERQSIPVALRREPQQVRSADLMAAILDAAASVLASEGARRFTTARVAERAGVSVGSLYQYFPNKASILFRLQSDEWRRTTALLSEILEVRGHPPLERLRGLVHAFLRSECEEAGLRVALADAAPLYRHAPEAQEAKAAGHRTVHDFLQEVMPDTPNASRELAGDPVTTTMSQVGKSFSATPRAPGEIEAYADAMADMFCAYLSSLGLPAQPAAPTPKR